MTTRFLTVLAALTMVTWGLAGAAATPLSDGYARDGGTPPVGDVPASVPAVGQDLAAEPLAAEERALSVGQELEQGSGVSDRLRTTYAVAEGRSVDADLEEPGPLAVELARAHAAEGDPLDAKQVADLHEQAAGLPAEVAEALAWLVRGARVADDLRPDVASSLSDPEIRELQSAVVPDDPAETGPLSLVPDGAAGGSVSDGAGALGSTASPATAQAHLVMAQAVDEAVALLEDVGSRDGGPSGQAAPPGDVFSTGTPYGSIYVSGPGANTYPQGLEALATVDLGGDDVYRNRAGAVNAEVLGLLGANPNDPADVRDRLEESNNVSVSLDVGGDDVYTNAGPGAQGFGGFGGFGALVNLGGSDTYGTSSTSLAQGAATVGGAGVLVDSSGEDAFTLATQGQGYTQDGGLGLLISGAGNDAYTSRVLAQGTGFIGGAGALVDGQGNDTYRCHGVADFSSFVLPVDVSRPGSTCQGAGFGAAGLIVDGAGDDTYETASSFRNFAFVGAGVQVDLAGDDAYLGAEWSNGNGVLGAGVLVDAGVGHDVFESVQSAGPWADVYVGSNGEGYTGGLGVLATGAGDDTVTSEVDKALFLNQYACGAGCAFSAGAGVLTSGPGDDTYRTEVGEGAAIAAPLAVLADGGGDDDYGLLYGSTRGQGYSQMGTPPVSRCNVALLADGAGDDAYDNPVTDFGTRTDGSSWGQGDYGRGIDGAEGASDYATDQGPADLQDAITRRACETVSPLS
jgi:hypothetical protein